MTQVIEKCSSKDMNRFVDLTNEYVDRIKYIYVYIYLKLFHHRKISLNINYDG